MKTNKIKGGVYNGYWGDFHKNKEAKKIAHKQARQMGKKVLALA